MTEGFRKKSIVVMSKSRKTGFCPYLYNNKNNKKAIVKQEETGRGGVFPPVSQNQCKSRAGKPRPYNKRVHEVEKNQIS